MITITINDKVKNEYWEQDFYRSLSSSHSGENLYEVISENDLAPNRVNEKSPNSRINITISPDCLVLQNSWDKYIIYALDNGLPLQSKDGNLVPIEWRDYVVRRMGLTDRNGSGLFPDLIVVANN